jgi:hypothetical protein
MATKSPADQVKEAVWKYTAQGVVLAVVFGAGVFVGYQRWGAGDMGQPALAKRVSELDIEINRVKNERGECQKTLEVTNTRKQQVEKTVTDLRKQLAAAKTTQAP